MIAELNEVWIIIIIGAVLGSCKSTLVETETKLTTKIINFLLGMYCGIMLAHSYLEQFNSGFIGLISLIGSMLGSNILSVIYEITPEITKKYIKQRFK